MNTDLSEQRIRTARALDDMVADAHRMGMYEIDQAEIAAAVAEARGKPGKCQIIKVSS